MLHSTYVENNNKSLPAELAKLLNENVSVWTNDACYGYCVVAMRNAGYSEEEITRLCHFLHSAFEEYTVEEAEAEWTKW